MRKKRIKTARVKQSSRNRTIDKMAHKMLSEAINETRFEDELVRILKYSNIKSNFTTI